MIYKLIWPHLSTDSDHVTGNLSHNSFQFGTADAFVGDLHGTTTSIGSSLVIECVNMILTNRECNYNE